MRLAVLASLALLSACGDGGVSSEGTDDPVAQNVVEKAAAGTPAAVAAAVDCGNKPDFVPVYADAEITTCRADIDGRSKRHVSGSIVYLTKAAPRAVLGWSRAQANAAGLGQRMLTDKSYSAGEDDKRSLLIAVEPMADQGSRVSVNWGDEVR
jgi:hypothetical protein